MHILDSENDNDGKDGGIGARIQCSAALKIEENHWRR